MRIALCNEVIATLPFERQCALAAELGYDGLEIAPFTLDDEPHLIAGSRSAALRKTVESAGIAVTGLHWLLVKPAGLSITSEEEPARRRTLEVMRRMIGLCAELGGKVLVHGSPAQRRLPSGPGAEAARRRGEEAFAAIAEDAQRAGVVYCIEPLAANETNFVNHLAEAAAIVRQIGNPALRMMLDCSAASQSEAEPLEVLVERWLPSGLLAHVQVNDRNQRGPGQGEDRFAPLFAALKRHNYAGVVAAEPFDYVPEGATCAARAIGYIRGILEALG